MSSIKRTKDEFIEKARSVHGDKYDYSNVVYNGSQEYVTIICPIHGEFEQMPNYHLLGRGCPKCKCDKLSSLKKYSKDEFIEKARKVHGDKYDYSKVDLENRDENGKVCIICPIHGEFWQKPSNHLQGRGCLKCGVIKSHIQKYTTDSFIAASKKVHGDKYDYSKTIFNGVLNNVTIICPKHGEFEQIAENHLQGLGCKKCGYEDVSKKLSHCKDLFVEAAMKVHGDKYDYSKVIYKNNKTKVSIICPKHGEFMVTPYNHIYNKSGCPHCSTSKMEDYLIGVLKDNRIEFEVQKKFDWLKNDRTNYSMRFDLYIPNKKIAIECQGSQHFLSGGFFTEERVLEIRNRDEVKYRLSHDNGITVFYFLPKELEKYVLEGSIYNKSNVFYDKELLLDRLKKE